MKNLSLAFLLILTLIFSNITCAQDSDNRTYLGKENAEYQLKEVIANNKLHNIINLTNKIIKSNETLIKIVEPILFDIYGKNNIEKQKPYEINDFENYYVINGTLKKEHIGGVFLIIIDKRNSQILKITHGK